MANLARRDHVDEEFTKLASCVQGLNVKSPNCSIFSRVPSPFGWGRKCFKIDMAWAACQIRKITVWACAGTPPRWVSNPDMHHGTCVTHVPWCMPRSLTNGFRWSRWRGKRSRHSRRMPNPQIYVSGKRPMGFILKTNMMPYLWVETGYQFNVMRWWETSSIYMSPSFH